jgi:hypothetical protein
MNEAGAKGNEIRQANRSNLLTARLELKDAGDCQPRSADSRQRGAPGGSERRA